MTDLSVYPYFDDFETSAKAKNYHKILFVPGNAVQARELTQIQSVLQEQVKRMGDHIFTNGSVVVPGNVFYDNNVTYLKLTPSYASVQVSSIGASLVGQTIVGTSGVAAHVVHFEPETQTDAPTLYVRYSEGNGTVHDFSIGEVLYSADLGLSVQVTSTADAIGKGTIVSISDGIFYINGYYVGVSAQTLVLDKYTTTPSCVAGLSFIENIVTASEDATLYDNAAGFSNYAAPGASRYQILLQLTKKNVDYTDITGQTLISFIPLLKIINGQIQFLNNETQYSAIEKMLARRTYDESGDFIVDDFTITAKNYRSNNRGAWTTSAPYIIGDIVTNAGVSYVAKNNGYAGATAPTHKYGVASDGSIQWLEVANPAFNDGVSTVTSSSLQDHIAAEQQIAIQTSTGKAYVKGFEVNVQSARTTIAQKARETEQRTDIQIYAPAGSYTLVDHLTGIIDTGTMTQVNLLDPSAVVRGTAWATALEYKSGTPGTTAAQYRLYLIGITMQSGYDFKDDILTVASTTGSTFSASFIQETALLSGFISTTAASAVVTGKGTLFTQELKKGDQVSINGVAKVVLSVDSDIQLTLTTTFASTLTDVPIYVLEINLQNTGNYITKLPNTYLRNMRKADGTIDTLYTVSKTMIFTAAGTSYIYSLTTGETFDGIDGIILVDTGTNAIVNATYSLDITATQLTIATGLTAAHNYKFIAKVKRNSATALEKTKTLTTKTIVVNAANVSDDYGNVLSTAWNFTSNVISLTECDVQRIIKITMSGADGAYNATGETDVTQWFSLNQNNKVDYYDICTVSRASNIIAPSRALKITFEFFDHSAGDYFSIDSYSSVPYSMIPSETHGGITYNLRDCLDFRSRVNDAGTGFTGTGGIVSTPLYSSSTIQTSYSYYLPRTDVLTLTASGIFEYINGVSAVSQPKPNISDGALELAVFSLNPYTAGEKDINIIPTLHRRYTMADISLLEDRLGNVEYYVALNELEKKTSSMQIYDSNGLTRYKNGFIADPFNSFDVADVNSVDFRAAIDLAAQVVRPIASTEKVPLVEASGTTPSSRLASGYMVTGDWISLPYTEEVLISQPFATRSENINPFAVFSWSGYAKLTPDKDTWVDTVVNHNTLNVTGGTYNSTIYQYTYVARAHTPAPVRSSGGIGFINRVIAGGGSVICTELYKQGFMDEATFKLDSQFGQLVIKNTPEIYEGYRLLADPIVAAMKNSKMFTHIVSWIALPWADEMARRMGDERPFNPFGWLVMEGGSKLCSLVAGINSWVNEKRKFA